MNKPSYADTMQLGDETAGKSSFTPGIKIEKGAYIMQIHHVFDVPEYDKFLLDVDFVNGENAGVFAKESLGQPSKWNRKGQVSVFYGERSEKQFSAFITSVMKSNPGFRWNWNEKELINKYIVVVYGEEEFVTREGKVAISIKPRYVRSIEALKNGEITIPSVKKLPDDKLPKEEQKVENNTNYTPSYETPKYNNNFGNVNFGNNNQSVPVTDDDLPF